MTAPSAPAIRRIRRPPPISVNHPGVVVRNKNPVTVGRFDIDDFSLAHHAHLLVAVQIAGSVGALAQELHAIHHLAFLREKGLAQALRPIQILVHAVQDFRERHQRLDADIPVLVLDRVDRVLAFQAGMLARPARGLRHFQRVGGRDQHLRQHAVRIQRDRRQHLVQIGLAVVLVVRRGRYRKRQRQNQDRNKFHGYFHGITFRSDLCHARSCGFSCA